MTKKHYVPLTRKLHNIYMAYIEGNEYQGTPSMRNPVYVVFDDIISVLADVLEEENDRFDRDKFYKAIYKG